MDKNKTSHGCTKLEITKPVKGDHLFHTYMSNLKALWDELVQHWSFTIKLKIFRQWPEEDKIFKLLVGFGRELDILKGHILMSSPLPHSTHYVLLSNKKKLIERRSMKRKEQPQAKNSL